MTERNAAPTEQEKCPYVLAWIGRCDKDGAPYCDKHIGVLCVVCQKQATKECDYAGQFVCGSPLCDDCGYETTKQVGFFGSYIHNHVIKTDGKPSSADLDAEDLVAKEATGLTQEGEEAKRRVLAVHPKATAIDWRGPHGLDNTAWFIYPNGAIFQAISQGWRMEARAWIDAASRLAAPAPEREPMEEYEWAVSSAKFLHMRFYSEVTNWKPLPDLLGVLTQISNMVAGLKSIKHGTIAERASKPAPPDGIVTWRVNCGWVAHGETPRHAYYRASEDEAHAFATSWKAAAMEGPKSERWAHVVKVTTNEEIVETRKAGE